MSLAAWTRHWDTAGQTWQDKHGQDNRTEGQISAGTEQHAGGMGQSQRNWRRSMRQRACCWVKNLRNKWTLERIPCARVCAFQEAVDGGARVSAFFPRRRAPIGGRPAPASVPRVCPTLLDKSKILSQREGPPLFLSVRARLWCPAGPPAAGKAPYTMTACCTSLSFLVASERGPKTQNAHGPGSGRLGRRRLSGRRDLHCNIPLETSAQGRHIRNGNISVQRTHIWLLWAALGRGGRLAVLGNCAHLCATPTQFALRTLRYAHLHFALRHLHQGPWRSRRLFATRPRRVGTPCGAFCGRPLPFSTGPLPPPLPVHLYIRKGDSAG